MKTLKEAKKVKKNKIIMSFATSLSHSGRLNYTLYWAEMCFDRIENGKRVKLWYGFFSSNFTFCRVGRTFFHQLFWQLLLIIYFILVYNGMFIFFIIFGSSNLNSLISWFHRQCFWWNGRRWKEQIKWCYDSIFYYRS